MYYAITLSVHEVANLTASIPRPAGRSEPVPPAQEHQRPCER
jgi:hypothetical protein